MIAAKSEKILLLDNYDSFTHNLLRALEQAGLRNIEVHANDAVSLAEAADYRAVVISPGPGYPSTSGICSELIRSMAPVRPVLGICLGHQAIAVVFGARLYRLAHPQHGQVVGLQPYGDNSRWKSMAGELRVGLYHSWAVDAESINKSMEITGLSDQGVIMSLRHRTFPAEGWQFHPESVMTPLGVQMLRSWGEEHQLISH